MDSREILKKYQLDLAPNVFMNLSVEELYQESINRKESFAAKNGPLVFYTGARTGRSPNDKFFVKEPSSESKIHWGKVNRATDQKTFDNLLQKVKAHLSTKDLFIQDCYAGADQKYRMKVRVITEKAFYALFSRHIFIHDAAHPFEDTDFTIIHAPDFKADPKVDNTNSEVFVMIDLGQRIILIGGTLYAGEIKKSIFTIMNYLMPKENVMPMHCSVNYGDSLDDLAIFFGLSGTGKTTLSAVSDRTLIGDDEHGWSPDGVFNFEGGCYAKTIRLSKENEPEIYATTQMFGTTLENVVMDKETGELDLDDGSITENTRVCYPLEAIPNMDPKGLGNHPKNIIMLTCDAFGVLPPVAKLSTHQALYHFLSGYTAKVAGTETGVTEPVATFSPCFGEPFMPLAPKEYAELLGKKMEEHVVDAWLVNTGWSGGPYGVGERMSLPVTRKIIDAILKGELREVDFEKDAFFHLDIPKSCPGVDAKVLHPEKSWTDLDAYKAKAAHLANMFASNMQKMKDVPDYIRHAGPTG